MLAILLAALEAAAPTVLPPLFEALGKILTAWLTKSIDTATALQQMHDAVTQAGVDMATFESQLAQNHADFMVQMQAFIAQRAALAGNQALTGASGGVPPVTP